MTCLPQVMIEEILLRLPVKSLLRFRCVSKSWLSIISRPDFAECYYQLSSQQRVLVPHYRNGQFYSVDFNVPFHDESVVVKLNFPLDRTPEVVDHYLHIIGSCRGFVCLFDGTDYRLFLWNPSTGASREVTQVKMNRLYLGGFAYDESTNDYLVVIVSDFLACYSLKTETLEILDDDCKYVNSRGLGETPGTIFNGAVHWFAMSKQTSLRNVILAFDIKCKSLNEVPLSDDFRGEYGELGVVGV